MPEFKKFAERLDVAVSGALRGLEAHRHALEMQGDEPTDPIGRARRLAHRLNVSVVLPRVNAVARRLADHAHAKADGQDDLYWCQCMPTVADRRVEVLVALQSLPNELHAYSKATVHQESRMADETGQLHHAAETFAMATFSEPQFVEWLETELIECAKACLK